MLQWGTVGVVLLLYCCGIEQSGQSSCIKPRDVLINTSKKISGCFSETTCNSIRKQVKKCVYVYILAKLNDGSSVSTLRYVT